MLLKRPGEWLERSDQIVAAAELKFFYRALADIEHNVSQVILHFGFRAA